MGGSRVGVVIATRGRPSELAATVARLQSLAEAPPIVVVDNASAPADAPPFASAAGVEVVRLGGNVGGAARTVGARRLRTSYVAFSDDDSWWGPGALSEAVRVLDAHPRLAVLAARVLVGDAQREDPVCEAMAASPLEGDPRLPGQSVLGFVACGSVVRRSAYLEVGGFHRRYGIGGEEELLAVDLAAAGWAIAYVEGVVAHHNPSPSRDPADRRRRQLRNALWSAWLRRPLRPALRRSARLVVAAWEDEGARTGALDALRGLAWVLRERRTVPRAVERRLRTLEA